MTFPKLELICPICSAPMNIIKEPELRNNVVIYKFQCQFEYLAIHRAKSKRRIGRFQYIYTLRITIPEFNAEDEFNKMKEEIMEKK